MKSECVSGKKQFQQQHVLALAVSCLFISGFSMMPIPVHAVEDYLSISGGDGRAGSHYNASTPANKRGGTTNDPGGIGGDSASPGGGGGGGSFIGVATVDPDAVAGFFSTGTTGAAGNVFFSGTAPDASGKNLYFHLPAGIAKDEVMRHSNSAVNTEGLNVDLAATGPIGHLSNGEKVILIDTTTGTIADNGRKTSIFYQGATQYDLLVESELSSWATARAREDVSGRLVLIREGKHVYGPVYAEGQIAGLAAVMQSSDLVARFGASCPSLKTRARKCSFPCRVQARKSRQEATSNRTVSGRRAVLRRIRKPLLARSMQAFSLNMAGVATRPATVF